MPLRRHRLLVLKENDKTSVRRKDNKIICFKKIAIDIEFKLLKIIVVARNGKRVPQT